MPETRTMPPIIINVSLGYHEEVTLTTKNKKINPQRIRARSGQQIVWTPADPGAQLLLVFCSQAKPVPSTVYLGGMADPITLTVRGPQGAQYKYAVAVITEPPCPPEIRADRCIRVVVDDPVIIIR